MQYFAVPAQAVANMQPVPTMHVRGVASSSINCMSKSASDLTWMYTRSTPTGKLMTLAGWPPWSSTCRVPESPAQSITTDDDCHSLEGHMPDVVVLVRDVCVDVVEVVEATQMTVGLPSHTGICVELQ